MTVAAMSVLCSTPDDSRMYWLLEKTGKIEHIDHSFDFFMKKQNAGDCTMPTTADKVEVLDYPGGADPSRALKVHLLTDHSYIHHDGKALDVGWALKAKWPDPAEIDARIGADVGDAVLKRNQGILDRIETRKRETREQLKAWLT